MCRQFIFTVFNFIRMFTCTLLLTHTGISSSMRIRGRGVNNHILSSVTVCNSLSLNVSRYGQSSLRTLSTTGIFVQYVSFPLVTVLG